MADSGALIADFVAASGRRSRVRRGDVVFHDGAPSTEIYACVSGRIRLVLSAQNGRELLIGFRGSRDLFGEMAALSGRPRCTTAIADSDSVIARVSADELFEELARRPELVPGLLSDLAGRLHTTTVRLVARNSERVVERVVDKLVALADVEGTNRATRRDGGDATIEHSVRLDISQTDLAEWVGTSRESVCRVLRDLRRDGLVETGRGHLLIRDLRRLASLSTAGPPSLPRPMASRT